MKDAYADGGAEEAIAALNETLELNIKDYVSLDLGALVEIILSCCLIALGYAGMEEIL